MGKRNIILIAVFLVSVFSSVQALYSQEDPNEGTGNDVKIQQAIELQKKAMSDQMKLREANQDMIKTARDSILNFLRSLDILNFYRFSMRDSDNDKGSEQPYLILRNDNSRKERYYAGEGSSDRTTWEFSKQVRESNFTKQYSFDVEKSARTIIMSVIGDCKSGEIKVKILMPGGKTFSDIVIDESGNLNWRKSISITDSENMDKEGEWFFKIKAENATGFFRISLQVY